MVSKKVVGAQYIFVWCVCVCVCVCVHARMLSHVLL